MGLPGLEGLPGEKVGLLKRSRAFLVAAICSQLFSETLFDLCVCLCVCVCQLMFLCEKVFIIVFLFSLYYGSKSYILPI